MKKTEQQSTWSLEEIQDALDGKIMPEEVASLMASFTERKNAEEREQARMNRAIAIIDTYDEVHQLHMEGGIRSYSTIDEVIDVAEEYLLHLENKPIVDAFDERVRTLSLYIISTLQGPYDGGEVLQEYLRKHPVQASVIRAMMRQRVVDRYGEDAWEEQFDTLQFNDLYDEMTYFDGASAVDVLDQNPLLEGIRQELVHGGYALKNMTGEEN